MDFERLFAVQQTHPVHFEYRVLNPAARVADHVCLRRENLQSLLVHVLQVTRVFRPVSYANTQRIQHGVMRRDTGFDFRELVLEEFFEIHAVLLRGPAGDPV